MMCPTYGTSESAFFSGSKKYYLKDVGKKAEDLLTPIRQREGWQKHWDMAYKTDRYFSPLRIILVSVDPIIMLMVPWTYQTALTDNYSAYDLHQETDKFEDKDYHGKFTFVESYTDTLMLIPIEFRDTLPVGTVQARVIMADFDKTTNIPPQAGSRTVVALPTYKLILTRTEDSKVLITFELP